MARSPIATLYSRGESFRMSVRVAIVDDDRAYREALADLLALEDPFEIRGVFEDAGGAKEDFGSFWSGRR